MGTAPTAAGSPPLLPPRNPGEQLQHRICLEGNSALLGSPVDGGPCLRGLSRGTFNLRSFLVATTPSVRLPKEHEESLPGSCVSEASGGADTTNAAGANKATGEKTTGKEGEGEEKMPDFWLSELWHSFDDASIFGLEVPLLDEEQRPTYVVYVPYLSAVHLFRRKKQQTQGGKNGDQGVTSPRLGGGFRFMEVRLPYQRRPLYQQVTQMLQGAEVTQSQELQLLTCSSEEVSDDSW